MKSEWIIAGVMMISLVLYSISAGADFGGGVWDLLSSGPRKHQQRALIERVIGPIWEANHVWLILVIVLLFSAFPPAFAAISIALHVPIILFLIGIVFRGSAFSFRSFDTKEDDVQKRWSLLFSLASAIAPILLGIIVGAIASGTIRIERGLVTSGFFASWLAPFPLVVGLFALGLFAFLAAVYLTVEAPTAELADDFRKRALLSGCLVALLAIASFVMSSDGAPRIRAGLTDHPMTWPLHIATAIAATLAFWGLWTRRFRLARVAAAAQTSLIVLGWGVSQYPYLVVPDITLDNAAGNPATLRLLIVALGIGSLLLFPSLLVLYRIFGKQRVSGQQ